MSTENKSLLKVFLINSLLLVFGVVCMWLVDIGQIGLFWGYSSLCNGAWCLSPSLIYHLGMYGSVIIIFSAVTFNICIITKGGV